MTTELVSLWTKAEDHATNCRMASIVTVIIIILLVVNKKKGARRVCRASKYSNDTQAIQHGLERVAKEKTVRMKY